MAGNKNILLVSLILFTASSHADISGNVAFTNDYIYRGISNSARSPAIQAGLDYYNDKGFYAGIWATTMDFQYPDGNPSYEFDMYGGISGTTLADINWELGFLRFVYPNGASKWKLDSHEFHLGLNRRYQLIELTTKYHYSPDYSGGGHSHYLEASLDIPLPQQFSLQLHSGHQWFKNNVWYGIKDYTDWRIALNRNIAGFDVDLDWTDTTIHGQAACFGGTDWCQSAVSLHVKRTF